jgi:chromosome segregation ATPase
LQWAANGIQTIRSISQAKIPEEITDTEFIELNEMRSLWNQLEAGAKQIIALNNITNVSVPEEPEGLAETANLTKVAELSDQIEQTKRRIAILSNDIPLPEPEEYPSGLSEAKSILSQIERLQAEETNLETALGATKKELEEVDIELAKIPVCKACNRPLLANHDHTLMA